MNGRYLLVASVISVQNSNFIYPSCQNCFSKLLLDSKRYSCLKCGGSGDTKEANYRYRLSLEVADTRGVSEVTVFGSCLDVYFGVTAKDLQRYIEELNQEAGEPDQGATPGVVYQAVETCFIGKKFVFAVKGFDRPDGHGSLQSSGPTDRRPKSLIACQMLAPNPELVGYTVIHYLQQQRSGPSMHGYRGLWPPDLFEAFDEPSWELSRLQYSGDVKAVPSRAAEGLSNFWPQSFRLTCSSTSSATVADLAGPNSSTAVYTKEKWEGDAVFWPSHSPCNVHDPKLTVTERSEEEEKKCPGGDHVKRKSGSNSSLGGKDCSLVHPPSKLAKRGSFCQMAVPRGDGLQHSGNPFSRHSALASPSSCARAGEGSRGDPGLWDELPSSESFNEFIANIENTTATSPAKADAGKHFPNGRTGELSRKPTPEPGMFGAGFKTRQPKEKLQDRAEKVGQHREGILSSRQASLLPCHTDNKSHQETFHSTWSASDKEGRCLPSQQPISLPPCSPAGVKLPHSKKSWHQTSSFQEEWSKEIFNLDVSFTNHHQAGCTFKPADSRLEDSWLQIRKITGPLSTPDHGTLAHCGGNEGPFCKPHQTTGVPGEGFGSANGEHTREISGGKRELPSQAHEYSFEVKPGGGLRDRSDGPMDSYNASADLFDSHREAEAIGRQLNSVHGLLARAGPRECSGTEQGRRSEFVPRELDASWNTSGHGWLPCDTLATSDPKTSTPISGFMSRSELGLVDSLDFIPPSQSTPLARPVQVSRPSGDELPMSKPPRSNAKCKRSRPPSKNPLVQRLVSKFLKSWRSNPEGSPAPDALAAYPLFIHSSPLQEVPANAGEDWIPPSGEKGTPPLAFQKTLKQEGLGRNRAYCQGSGTPPLSENKRWGTRACSSRLIKVEFSSVLAETNNGSQPRPTNDASDRQLVDVSRLHQSPTSHSVSAIPNWSPELF